MKKEIFRDDLGNDEWPLEAHEPMLGHSIPLGQFALLVKKDPGAPKEHLRPIPPVSAACSLEGRSKKPRLHPARDTTDWCPPGTSTVWSGQGSIHTCSDKICRWNYLGLQGSLLASLMQKPIYMSTLTVGRKLTECICRRAVCCRAAAVKSKTKKKRKADEVKQSDSTDESNYKINHPAIMGTAVYMDESGVIASQDVRFHSTLSWAWWPSIGRDAIAANANTNKQERREIECIDGATGLASEFQCQSASSGRNNVTNSKQRESRLSTSSLVCLYSQVAALRRANSEKADENSIGRCGAVQMATLAALRNYKRQSSPIYEAQKLQLLSKHPLFRQWNRRASEG